MSDADGLRRRAERTRARLDRLRPPERAPSRSLADLGDPVLERLGEELIRQEWLDQVQAAEAVAEMERHGLPATGEFRLPGFERDGVVRLPVSEQLRLARMFTDRYQLALGLSARPEVELRGDRPLPPAELVAKPAPPDPEPVAPPEPVRHVAHVRRRGQHRR